MHSLQKILLLFLELFFCLFLSDTAHAMTEKDYASALFAAAKAFTGTECSFIKSPDPLDSTDVKSRPFEVMVVEEKYHLAMVTAEPMHEFSEDKICVDISFDFSRHEAHLNLLIPKSGCFTPNVKPGEIKMGECLLKYTVAVMKQVHAHIPSITKFSLTDLASVPCPRSSYRYSLSPYLLMTKGYTFYGKQGFQPETFRSVGEIFQTHEYKIMKEQYALLTVADLISDPEFPQEIKSEFTASGREAGLAAQAIDNYRKNHCADYATNQSAILRAWLHKITKDPALIWNLHWEIKYPPH